MKARIEMLMRTRFGRYLIGDWLSAFRSMPNSTGLNSYRRWENRKHISGNFSCLINHTEIMFLRWTLLLMFLYSISEKIAKN